MTTGRENATAQQKAIGERAQRAVLERVAHAIENELPMLATELILSGDTERMHRISHPTYMDEPVYLRVTASWLPADEARRLFPGADGDPDTTSAGRTTTEPELGFQKEIAQAKADLNLFGEPHATAEDVAAVCCPRCRVASKYKTGCEDPNCQCHQPKGNDRT